MQGGNQNAPAAQAASAAAPTVASPRGTAAAQAQSSAFKLMKDAKKDKPRRDALPSSKSRRTRPKKSTIKSWEEGICTSTPKLLVGHPDCWAKVAFSRKQWMDIQEKVKNTPDWDEAIRKGWIKPNECKGTHASTQYEVCSCSAGPLLLRVS